MTKAKKAVKPAKKKTTKKVVVKKTAKKPVKVIKKTVAKKATAKKAKKITSRVEVKVKKTKKSQGIELQDLLEAGCHFGHSQTKTHPRIKDYLYTTRDGVAIFDLVKTKECLDRAQEFVTKLVSAKKKIVFVGAKRQAREVVKKAATDAEMPYVINRWLGGTITNWEEIKKNSVDKLNRLKKEWDEGKYQKRPKKEQSLIRHEIARLERIAGGLAKLDVLFDAIFVVDIKAEETAVKEARAKGMPVIAVVDSNCDPTLVDYPIPANDDAVKSIQLLVNAIAQTAKKASKSEQK
ncbi:MAG: 30S ribosomal protein S2 [Patescibacteria group bacterium]